MGLSPFQYPKCWKNWSSLLPRRKSVPLQISVRKFLSFMVGVEMNPRKLCGGCLRVSVMDVSAYGWCHAPSLPISVTTVHRLENAVERWWVLDFRLARSYLGTASLKDYDTRLLLVCFCALSGPSWEMMQDLERERGTRWKKTWPDWTDISQQVLLASKAADMRHLAGSDICHHVRVFTANKTLSIGNHWKIYQIANWLLLTAPESILPYISKQIPLQWTCLHSITITGGPKKSDHSEIFSSAFLINIIKQSRQQIQILKKELDYPNFTFFSLQGFFSWHYVCSRTMWNYIKYHKKNSAPFRHLTLCRQHRTES